MTIARRVAVIESSLTPTQLVLRWLSEAHAHGSFETYGRALLDEEPDQRPLNRLCREAQRVARATVRSRVPEQIDQAVAKAVRETAFRFMLVLRINVVTHELLEKEQLFQALSAAHLALLAGATHKARQEESHTSWLTSIVQLVVGRASELESASQARVAVEERYLDGRSALFPDAIEAWDAQVHATQEMTAMALALAELDGVDPPPQAEDALAERTADLVADLVQPAKATALEKLGEGERGLQIANDWLRSKVRSASVEPAQAATL